MSEILGINTREVWEHRLSIATILIDRRGGTWVCQIWAKNNPDYMGKHTEFDRDTEGKPTGEGRVIPATPLAQPLETHDTKIAFEKGDERDCDKVKVCFEWFKSVRDKYALPNIEELKPEVAAIREIEEGLHELSRNAPPSEGALIFAQYKYDLDLLGGAS